MCKLFIISLVAMVLISCNSSGERKSVDTTTYPTTLATPSAPISDSNKQVNITSTPVAPISTTPANSNGALTLNPAHGAPGHRCDIAVGQPLNGPASTAPSPTAGSIPTPTISLPQNPVQPNNNTTRLNPAHGAPGHDCSIAVGQPLKS